MASPDEFSLVMRSRLPSVQLNKCKLVLDGASFFFSFFFLIWDISFIYLFIFLRENVLGNVKRWVCGGWVWCDFWESVNLGRAENMSGCISSLLGPVILPLMVLLRAGDEDHAALALFNYFFYIYFAVGSGGGCGASTAWMMFRT